VQPSHCDGAVCRNGKEPNAPRLYETEPSPPAAARRRRLRHRIDMATAIEPTGDGTSSRARALAPAARKAASDCARHAGGSGAGTRPPGSWCALAQGIASQRRSPGYV